MTVSPVDPKEGEYPFSSEITVTGADVEEAVCQARFYMQARCGGKDHAITDCKRLDRILVSNAIIFDDIEVSP